MKRACVVLLAFATAPALAQDGEWVGQVTPYVWGAGLGGDLTPFTGAPTLRIDKSFREVLEDSDGAFFISGLARRDRLVLMADFSTSSSSRQGRVPPGIPGEGKLRQSSLTLAAGARVHASGQPFTDPSGDRLRDWCGLSPDDFYDQTRVAIVPMAFCFPGHDVKGSDLPPPPICASTWRKNVMDALPKVRLTLLVGGAAQVWHLGPGRVSDRVLDWRTHAATGTFPLPHPSWRNTAWLRRNPWFETQIVPELRTAVRRVMEDER